ncbi:MAG: hypothetical protein K2J18_01590 [Paramuribaculum sp.]|nr:hypothetical protein [Paramuribaculum sp.]MDE7471468.1 hypothetical protein [Paramuribaculum sp.]
MRALFTILLYITVSALHAQIPDLLGSMIEKYPSAYRRVWYYFDHDNGMEYYRTQFSATQSTIDPADISRISAAYSNEWNNTDFNRAVGTQYLSPDSTSITIKGQSVMAMDLGPSTISTDWGREVKCMKKWRQPALDPIVKAFDLIKKGHRCQTVRVSYTGFPKGIVFVFHRGKGRGLTSGQRTTVNNVSLSDFQRVRRAILNFIGKPVPVTVFDRTWQTMIKSETTPEFYAVGYDPQKKILNFLHCTVENEICIPLNWQTINHIP